MDRGIIKPRTLYIIILTYVNVPWYEIMMCTCAGNHTNVLGTPGNSPRGAGAHQCLPAGAGPAGPGCWHVPGAPTAPAAQSTGSSELDTPSSSSSTDTQTLHRQSELCSGTETLTIYIYMFQSTQLETELCPFLRLWNILAPNTGLYSPLAWASLFLSCSCTPYGSRPWDKFCTDLWPLQAEGLTYSINLGGRAHGQPARSSPLSLLPCTHLCWPRMGDLHPHWEQIWAQHTSGQPSRQWDPAGWTARVPVHPGTPSNRERGMHQICQQQRSRQWRCLEWVNAAEPPALPPPQGITFGRLGKRHSLDDKARVIHTAGEIISKEEWTQWVFKALQPIFPFGDNTHMEHVKGLEQRGEAEKAARAMDQEGIAFVSATAW